MATVYHTFSPKVARYYPDGSGRDAYVVTDSGGAFKVKSHTLESPVAKAANFYLPRSPRSEAKPFKYRCDGSGRDGYILTNHGGLYSEDHRARAFHETLRDFPAGIRQRSAGLWISETAKRHLRSLHRSQRELTTRLLKTYKTNSLNSPSATDRPRRLSPMN